MNKLTGWLGMLAMAVAGATAAHAQQSWPQKPVRIIIPAAPGGVTDLQARLAGTKAAQVLGQPFVIDNKPGAGTTLGTAMVAKAPPDGYTILCMTGSFTTASVTYANLPYDPINDLVPVSQFTIIPNLLAVAPTLPIHSMKDYVAYAKANPGKMNFGTTGTGTLAHLAGAWLEELTGTKVTFVPYKDIAAMVGDLAQGRLDATIGSPSNLLAHVKSGRMRALGWTGKQRSRLHWVVNCVAEHAVTSCFDRPDLICSQSVGLRVQRHR